MILVLLTFCPVRNDCEIKLLNIFVHLGITSSDIWYDCLYEGLAHLMDLITLDAGLLARS